MTQLDAAQASAIQAAVQSGLADIQDALQRAFDGGFSVSVGSLQTNVSPTTLPHCAGRGWAAVFEVGASVAVVLIPESSGMLPPWYASPDITERSRLETLAQELGVLLFPESLQPRRSIAVSVADLGAALVQAGCRQAACLPLQLQRGDQTGSLLLIWPVANPSAFVSPPAVAARAPAQPAVASHEPASPRPLTARMPRLDYDDVEDGLGKLPPYSRSLLRVRIPISVTLAETRRPLAKILEMGPGSILHFSKPCDDALSVVVGHHEIARGEAVKVGDKFGIWVTSISLPKERFWLADVKGYGPRAS